MRWLGGYLMARFTFFNALGPYGAIDDIVDTHALTPSVTTPDTATLLDPQGDGFSLFGSGLTYSATGITGGTINGINVFTGTDQPLIRVEFLSVNALSFWDAFSQGGVSAAYFLLTAGRDNFIGSGVADVLDGSRGNDRINGKGGADQIVGGPGDDTLIGGSGPDLFDFFAGDGKDTIKDFQDAGLTTDDMIVTTTRMFRAMVVTDTQTGVELDFGAKGMLIVDGWHAIDVQRDDFFLF